MSFSATIVESFQTFWIDVNSVDVRILNVGEFPITNPVSTTTTSTTSTTIKPIDNTNDVYKGCSETKTCFGLPTGCISSQNCISLGAVIYKDSRIIFEMMSSSK